MPTMQPPSQDTCCRIDPEQQNTHCYTCPSRLFVNWICCPHIPHHHEHKRSVPSCLLYAIHCMHNPLAFRNQYSVPFKASHFLGHSASNCFFCCASDLGGCRLDPSGEKGTFYFSGSFGRRPQGRSADSRLSHDQKSRMSPFPFPLFPPELPLVRGHAQRSPFRVSAETSLPLLSMSSVLDPTCTSALPPEKPPA